MGLVFGDAFGIFGVVIAGNLLAQGFGAEGRLAALIMIGFAVYGVFIGGEVVGVIDDFPAAVVPILPALSDSLFHVGDGHGGGGGVALEVVLVALIGAFAAADAEIEKQGCGKEHKDGP